MRFVDTHVHLYDEQFQPDLEQLIKKAISSGVEKMYLPNCDSTTIPAMMSIAEQWKDNCFPMMGLHPVYVKDNYREELDIVKEWLEKTRFYAIGEIGLDKYWDQTHIEQQKDAFALQVDWALEYDLPVVIHSREATQDCIDIIADKQNGKLRGIFHCFGGTPEEARQIIDLGLFLGIGGVVTFNKNPLPEILSEVGMDHIVLETDAPYLAPVPYRGKRNESAYIPLMAEKIASVLNITTEEVASITTKNAEKVFRN